MREQGRRRRHFLRRAADSRRRVVHVQLPCFGQRLHWSDARAPVARIERRSEAGSREGMNSDDTKLYMDNFLHQVAGFGT